MYHRHPSHPIADSDEVVWAGHFGFESLPGRAGLSGSQDYDDQGKDAMSRVLVLILPALFAAALIRGCSSGDGRQLQSIAISQTTNGEQVQFTASGTFSAPPTKVTPLAVSWGIGLFAPPPPGNLRYTLTTEPFVFHCSDSDPVLPVSVFAPSDPNAAISGSLPFKDMVTAHAKIQCPRQ